ncbi:MAG: 3-dehydroquinate synthase II [Nitrososphaeraceae archaeon]
MTALSKDLIIRPMVSESYLDNFLAKLKHNITFLNIDPKLVSKRNFKTIYESEDANITICRTIDELEKNMAPGKVLAYYKKVSGNEDVDEIVQAAEAGSQIVVVETSDWKIIPLENIIAKLHKSRIKVYATAKNANEVRTMFGVLELGVDGVILSANNVDEVNESRQYLETKMFPIKPAKILDIKDVGSGERVCIDTVSILKAGEGMLIGTRSNFMLLIHNESFGSSFTSPRPFRVNAGAVYCYTITPDGNTKYLSEIESGTEVLIVNKDGISRRVTVGRSKIETRPLRLIKAQVENEIGTAILQNAETIRFMTPNGKLMPITEAKVGDEILAYVKPPSGRHFGLEVNEFIIEK